MVVAVIAVGMVQMARHQVVYVIAVRDRLVAAVGTVRVPLRMPTAGVLRRACIRVRRVDLQDVLIHVVAMRVVQVAFMQVIGVAVMVDRDVAASRSMLMAVVVMYLAVLLGHGSSSRR